MGRWEERDLVPDRPVNDIHGYIHLFEGLFIGGLSLAAVTLAGLIWAGVHKLLGLF